MTLSRKIADALDENTRAYNAPCTVTVDDGPDRISMEIAAVDAVGVAVDALEYQATDRREWTAQSLNDWGVRISKRLTYLLEPVKVHEVDGGAGEVRLRSEAPTLRHDLRGYYELRLTRRGACRVERYAFDPKERRRRRTPCHFTREMIERLADDIAAVSR